MIEKPWQAGVLTPHQKQILTRNTSHSYWNHPQIYVIKNKYHTSTWFVQNPNAQSTSKKKQQNIKNYSKNTFFSGWLMTNKASWTWRNLWDSLVVSQTKVTSNPETPWSKRHKHTIVYTFIWILWNTYEYLWHLMSPCPWQFLSDPIWKVRDPNKSRNQKKEKHHPCKVLYSKCLTLCGLVQFGLIW